MRTALAPFIVAVSLGASAGGSEAACLRIDRVAVDGAGLIAAEQISRAASRIEGKCLPFETALSDIDAVLQALTLAYVELGYIAARAWLPEQNLADGVLEIRVVEGALGSIRFNNAEDPRWEARSFPGQRGQPVQLRRVEQGLDVIRSMPGFSAQMDLSPGQTQGTSDLLVEASGRPWQLRLSSTNSGTDRADEGAAAATGQFVTSLDGSLSHVLGLNETFRINLSRSQPEHPFNLFHEGPRTWGGSLSLEVPTGPLLLRGSFGWTGYATEIPGAFSPIPVTGWTQTLDVGGSYLMHRDRVSKTRLTFGVTRRENENSIAGVRIETSSRVLTSLRLGVQHERSLWGGQFEAMAGYERGLRLFGAEDAAAQPAGQPNAQYSLFDAELRYRRMFEAGADRIGYTTSVRGQISPDLLYGTQQFNLGGVSSVRGTKAVVLSGNQGVVWRNELTWQPAQVTLPAQLGRLEFYATGDIGYIVPDTGAGITGGIVSGASLGARLAGGSLDLDASFGQILQTPAGVARPEAVFLVSAGWRF